MAADEPKITEADFPALYGAADQNSLSGQQAFLRATNIRLTLLVIAAFLGIFTWRVDGSDVAGILAACAFGGALIAELYLLRTRPDRVWYDGRAAAESSKTLTWRYIVGGAPFGRSIGNERENEERLLKRFEEIVHDLRGVQLVPPANQPNQITAAMRSVRALPLAERRKVYRQERIEDQRSWYARKARWNERQASRWSNALALMEAGGMIAAILKATRVLDVDLLGLTAAIVGAGAAWVQTKQHQMLASAYAVASQELADINSRIDWVRTEKEWSEFVDQAEEAISREHTLWRASHSA